MFCSEECRNKAASLHLNETLNQNSGGIFEKSSIKMILEAFRVAGGVDELLELLKESEGKTIFDCDFSDPDEPNCEKNMLIALNGLNKNVQSSENMRAYLGRSGVERPAGQREAENSRTAQEVGEVHQTSVPNQRLELGFSRWKSCRNLFVQITDQPLVLPKRSFLEIRRKVGLHRHSSHQSGRTTFRLLWRSRHR